MAQTKSMCCLQSLWVFFIVVYINKLNFLLDFPDLDFSFNKSV